MKNYLANIAMRIVRIDNDTSKINLIFGNDVYT